MERRGSGFKKICEDYAFAEGYTDEKKPRFIFNNDNFTLILSNQNYKVGKNTSSTRNGTQTYKAKAVIGLLHKITMFFVKREHMFFDYCDEIFDGVKITHLTKI